MDDERAKNLKKYNALQVDIQKVTKAMSEAELETPGGSDKGQARRKCAVVTILCLINLFANSAYSSIAPFFPKEAVSKGLPISSVGFIFSGYSVSMCIFAPMFNHMLNSCGRKNVLIFGVLFEATAMLCFGLFDLIDNPIAYGILCCFCRFIEGFGNGCLNSATNSIIQFNYTENAGNLIGLT